MIVKIKVKYKVIYLYKLVVRFILGDNWLVIDLIGVLIIEFVFLLFFLVIVKWFLSFFNNFFIFVLVLFLNNNLICNFFKKFWDCLFNIVFFFK